MWEILCIVALVFLAGWSDQGKRHPHPVSVLPERAPHRLLFLPSEVLCFSCKLQSNLVYTYTSFGGHCVNPYVGLGATGIFAVSYLAIRDRGASPVMLISLIAFFSILWLSAHKSCTGFVRSPPKHFTWKVIVRSTAFYSP